MGVMGQHNAWVLESWGPVLGSELYLPVSLDKTFKFLKVS